MATHEQLSHLLAGREVDSVRQRGAEIDIDFTDGSTLSLKLAAPTGCIRLVNEDDKQEFSG
ncbi:MAG TPA: hypothetical protein VFB38_02175 [Chthonomonadaceae bacterium]|nr:hypothetical protein [Chthonomonadaceae bacterium]